MKQLNNFHDDGINLLIIPFLFVCHFAPRCVYAREPLSAEVCVLFEFILNITSGQAAGVVTCMQSYNRIYYRRLLFAGNFIIVGFCVAVRR